jgi:ParB family chromosome partitioning protein
MKAAKKRVLGRGLSALIGEAASAVVGDAKPGVGGFMICPIGKVSPNKDQPRKVFEKTALAQLTDSIKEKGVIEPLVVRKNSSGFELIAGERRFRAAKNAGLKEVPVIVMEATDLESLELAIVENVQREDLNAIEEAEAYNRLLSFGLSQSDVAKKVGKDRVTVTNYLRLLKLPERVREELAVSAISMGHARAILSLEGAAQQNMLCKKVIRDGLSVRETERLAASGFGNKTIANKAAAKKTGVKTHIESLEEELRITFGTKVSVVERGGKGKVEINFYSKDERERIFDLLKQIG